METPERVTFPFSLEDFPDIIDVRTPSEFADDHLPGAINLPVLDDQEHHEVGLIYAKNTFEARRRGATLITKNIYQHLDHALRDRERDFSPLLYCWRGNLRSNSMAIILRAIGWRTRVLKGGYKAWRSFLIRDLEKQIQQKSPQLIVLSGLTGCGKTRLLQALKKQGAQVLDLEHCANHKGSILGNATEGEQPSQKLFESRLWNEFRHFDATRPVFTEAESNRIGKAHCPPPLWKQFSEATVVEITLPLHERAQFLQNDYPHFLTHPEKLKEKLNGLRRVCGHQQVDQWQEQIDSQDWNSFLTSILKDHYDQVYRRPGTSDSTYQKPSLSLSLEKADEETFTHQAKNLITHFSA